MVHMTLQFSLEIRYVCVQCGKDMVIEGQKVMNPTPLLKCPDCGFRVQVKYGPGVPGIPGVKQLPKSYRPTPKT